VHWPVAVAASFNAPIPSDWLKRATRSRRSYGERTMSQLSATETTQLLLRGLWFAIIDEADSVLIDEARTPLIISGMDTDPNADSIYLGALNFASQLQPDTNFTIPSTDRSVQITASGSAKLKQLTQGLGGIREARKARDELVSHALSALHLFKINQHYVVVDGKIQIIDEFTGCIAEGRSWQHGLHQLIEAKESCEITQRQQTRASITYQRFFRRYLHLSGMSGTLSEVAAELRAVYAAPLARIPTNCTVSENMAPVPFESAYAIWTSWQHSCDRDDQALMQRGDLVGNVTLGPDRRRRGVGNYREWQVF
jgi:preprotein translocase subunit SecA